MIDSPLPDAASDDIELQVSLIAMPAGISCLAFRPLETVFASNETFADPTTVVGEYMSAYLYSKLALIRDWGSINKIK